MTFDHIGIVAPDVGIACQEFAAAIGAKEISDRIEDDVLDVTVQFIRDEAGIVYEMIAPLGAQSPVAKTLRSRANLLNQIAYRCPDLTVASVALRQSGALPLGPPKPARAFGGARVQFFYMRLGFVVELIETTSFSMPFHPIGAPPGGRPVSTVQAREDGEA